MSAGTTRRSLGELVLDTVEAISLGPLLLLSALLGGLGLAALGPVTDHPPAVVVGAVTAAVAGLGLIGVGLVWLLVRRRASSGGLRRG